jgi:hypothetical protein
LANIDSPVKDYKKKQRIFKHSPFWRRDVVTTVD